MIYEFIIVLDNSVEFSKTVSDKLKQGYQLYGNPGIYTENQDQELYYYQAITKIE
jgi:hypothetical protein